MVDLTNGGTSTAHVPESIIGKVFFVPRYNMFMRVVADNEDGTLEVSIPCYVLGDAYSAHMSNTVPKKYFVENVEVPVLGINCQITSVEGYNYITVISKNPTIQFSMATYKNYLNELDKKIAMFDLSKL